MAKSGKPRGRETFLDMVRSMLVLGAAVGLVLLVTWRPADSKPTVAPVDAHAVAVGAANQLSFTPLELDLGANWRATSAWVESVPTDITKSHWHVSYVKGESQYVAIDQSDTSAPDSFIAELTTAEVGVEEINGTVWKTFSGDNEDVIAVKIESDVVTLITANSYPLLLKVISNLS